MPECEVSPKVLSRFAARHSPPHSPDLSQYKSDRVTAGPAGPARLHLGRKEGTPELASPALWIWPLPDTSPASGPSCPFSQGSELQPPDPEPPALGLPCLALPSLPSGNHFWSRDGPLKASEGLLPNQPLWAQRLRTSTSRKLHSF